MRTLTWRAAAAACLTVTLGTASACTGDSASPPLTDVAELTTTLPTASTVPPTTAAPTTVAATTSTLDPTATTAMATLGLSPDGPWTLVDSAPGVEGVGLVYELMPKLWVFLPTEVDLERGYLWTFNEQDRPVIEAYLLAILTRYRSTDSVPATLDDEGWTLYYTQDLRDRVLPGYQEESDAGVYTDLDLGVVLRPQVTQDNRTDATAVLLDCRLDGAVARLENGSLAPDATPGVLEAGYVVDMRITSNTWRVAGYDYTPAACA